MKNYPLSLSFIICIAVYIIALVAAIATIKLLPYTVNPLVAAFVADVVATIVVFCFSAITSNASLYDAYWSVAPPVILWYWLTGFNADGKLWVILPVMFWAIRLTLNWARGWHGLAHQDWRYTMLYERNPKMYWLTNLGGIHLFPTVMVFLGMLPVYYMLPELPNPHSQFLVTSGCAISIIATFIELIADEQMRYFKTRAQRHQYINIGLWKYSRHPNYFGEILFWFGLWVMLMGAAPQFWWTAIGFAAMTIMFVFASIPMMEEKNLKNKLGYQTYVNSVSMLIPWFRKG